MENELIKNEISPEHLENIKQILREISISNTNQGLIQDNKNYFSYKGKSYRCEMPNQIQQTEAEDYKDAYKMNNLQRFPLESALKKKWKEAGVDIDAMEQERQKLREEYQIQAIKGATILSHEKEALEKHKKLMEDIENKLMECLISLEEHMSTSLDKKSIRQYYRYLAYKCTKYNDKGTWIPVWNSFEDFDKDDSGLPYKAIAYIQSLLLHIRE